jgi:dynein heavy chain
LSIKSKLAKGQLDSKRFVAHSIGFSARTSENQTQDIIDGKMSKRRKGVYGPPVGKRGIVFVDDLNMPAKETYGAQPPIELLRQWMDMGGWYDRGSKDKSFKHVVDLTFVAAMGPPGGARSEITQRYMRHYNVVNVVQFSGSSLDRIFGVIVGTHAARNNLSGGAKMAMSAVVQATVDLFNALALEMRPTPKKSHYIFNLRDLSNVFQGVLNADPVLLVTSINVARLWVHECLRVFSDRLIDEDDRGWMRKQVSDVILPGAFKLNWKNVVEVRIPRLSSATEGSDQDLDEEQQATRDAEPLPPLLFGSFTDSQKFGDQRQYMDLGPFGHGDLIALVQSYLSEYNMSRSDGGMDLVLFMYCIEHVVRVCRVLGQMGGNALLVGVGGSGRKSVTALAAFISNQKLEQIELTKSYGFFEWREDLKRIMRQSGLEDQETVFQLSDTQLVDEVFVEDINNLLNTGEVPNLFPDDEMVVLMEELTAAGLTGGDEEETGGDGEDGSGKKKDG